MSRILAVLMFQIVVASFPLAACSDNLHITFVQRYVAACQNYARISSLSRQFFRANDLLEEQRYTLARNLGTALYDCAASSGGFTRDYSKLFSITFVAYASLKRDSERLAYQLNELAASTQYPLVRRMALSMRDKLRADE